MSNNEEAGDNGSVELPHPLLVPVRRALDQRDALAHLCGEMLATIMLPHNQEHQIKELANEVDKWRAAYRKGSGK